MVNNPVSSNRKTDSNVVVDSRRMNDSRMKLNAVSNLAMVNSPVSDKPESERRRSRYDRPDSNQDSLKAINLSAASNRGSNPDKLKRDSLNPASN